MRVLELYSGIGGMHYALNESGVEGKIIIAMDINVVANGVYKFNFPVTQNKSRNIQSLAKEEIHKLNVDTILMSPPCQPFTRQGLKKDLQDNRCSSLSHILQLIPQLNELKNILVENVQGFESSTARFELISMLEKSGFNYKEFLLSPCQFGIPNSRQRYYLIAKKKGFPFLFHDPSLEKCIPEKVFELLAKRNSVANSRDTRTCYTLKHVVESNADPKYLIPQKVLKRRAQILDIRTESSNGTCCFTKAYSRYVEGTGSVFSPCSEDQILETYEQLEGRKEIPEEKMELVSNLRLRYFTPREVSRLMCFPEHFEFPEEITDKQKYRLLGNSINIYVVSVLIYLLNYEGI